MECKRMIYGFGYSAVDDNNKQVIRIEPKAYLVENHIVDKNDPLAVCFLKWIKPDRPRVIETSKKEGNTPEKKDSEEPTLKESEIEKQTHEESETQTEQESSKIQNTKEEKKQTTSLSCFKSHKTNQNKSEETDQLQNKSSIQNSKTQPDQNEKQKQSNTLCCFKKPENKPAEIANEQETDNKKADQITRGTRSPEFILSLAGGASNFVLKRRYAEKLRRGLHKVLSTDNAWVVTGGTDVGIMRLCGLALEDQKISEKNKGGETTRGVVSVGVVSLEMALGVDTSSHEEPFTYEKPEGQPHSLDLNHDYFIIVEDSDTEFDVRANLMSEVADKLAEKSDNSEEEDSDTEFDVRANLMSEVAEKLPKKTGLSKVVEKAKKPTVCVLIEGGTRAIDAFSKNINAKNPCIVISGTGRAADFLARTKTLYDRDPNVTLDKVKKVLSTFLEIETEDDINKYSELALGCLKEHNEELDKYMRICKIDSVELDKNILELLYLQGKNQNTDTVEQGLNLCLSWDRAEQFGKIIRQDRSKIKPNRIFDYFKTAVKDNQFEVIKTLLDLDTEEESRPEDSFQLQKLLTYSELNEIYSESNQSEFQIELRDDEISRTIHLNHVEGILEKDVHFKYEPKLKNWTGIIPRKQGYTKKELEEIQKDKMNATLENPVREMFVHSILFNRLESSLYFWENLQCKVSAALFAAWILENTLTSLEKRMDLTFSSKVEKIRKSYDELAIGIVNHCFQYDKEKCEKMLEKKHDCWGKINCVDLAVGAQTKSFISQAACQSISKKTWRGKITYSNSRFKIALALFLPFLMIPFVIHFRNEPKRVAEPKTDAETSKAKKDSNPQNGSKKLEKEDGSQTDDHKPEKNSLRSFFMRQLENFSKFYTAPMIVFCVNTLSFMVFLIIFSWVVLHGLEPEPRVGEYYAMVYVVTAAMEEGRQLLDTDALDASVKKNLKMFFRSGWNYVDMIAINTFFIGAVMRIDPIWGLMGVAHGFYVCSLTMFIIRLSSAYQKHEYLGLKVVMIAKMIPDLMYFICIAIVYIVAYGVAVQALVYPDTWTPEFSLPWGIFFRPLFEMLGDPNFEDVGATHFDNCINGADAEWPYNICPQTRKTIYALSLKAIFMLLTNVLLLNLLIAIFNNRYTAVDQQSKLYLKYQSFAVTYEYRRRPCLPPPFSFFEHVWMMIKLIRGECRTKVGPEKNKQNGKEQGDSIDKWEMIRANEYLSSLDEDEGTSNEDLSDELQELKERLRFMDEEQKEEKANRIKELKDELKKEKSTDLQSKIKDELKTEIETNAKLLRDEINTKDELQSKIKDELRTEIEINAKLLRDEINTKDEKLDSMYKLLQKIDKTTSAPSTTGAQGPKTSGY